MVSRSVSLLVFVLALSFIPASSILALGAPVSGRVLDPSGRPVPRAIVRALDASGRTISQALTTLDGTFRIDVPSGECRLEASLTGFAAAAAACGPDVQLTLGVAPLSESIVVSATRSEAPSSQIAASVTVFSAEDIDRRQTPPLADLLVTAPGVTLSRSGAPGSVASIFVRGGESNYNKVLLDGIPINEPGGVFNFSNITSENLERVELVRGAHSALFGSDAMASVIQMFTRRAAPGQRPQVGASIEVGSFDTARAHASVRGASGGFDYSLALAHIDTNNQEPNSAFRNDTVSAALGYQFTPRTSVRAVLRGEFGEAGTPGQTAFGRADMDAYFDRRDAVAGVTFQQDVSSGFRHRVTYGYAATRQDSANLESDPPYTPSYEGRLAAFEFFDFPFHSRNDLRRHYATYQTDWTFSGGSTARGVHQLTGAVDWDGERGTVEDVLERTSTEFTRDNFGLTIQHQASWNRVFATAGVRFEHNESFGASAAPRASLAVIARRGDALAGDTRLKVSAGRGIKEPTALQSFSTSPFFLGNPDLEPEESTSLEAGLEQRFAGDRMRIEATWFHNRFRNIISTRTISFSPFRSQYFNIGKTEARGLELSAAFAPSRVLQVRGGYTLLDSRIVETRTPDDPVFGTGQWLFRRPRHSGFVEASAARGPVLLSLTGLFVGRRVDSDFSALAPAITENEARATWDVRGSYRLTRVLALTAAIDNLTGAEYMEPLGYPGLGRSLRVGLRAGF